MKKWLIPLVAFILGLVSLIFDKQIVKFASIIRAEILTEFFLGIELISSTIILILVFVFIAIFVKRIRVPIVFSIGATVLIGFLLKILVQRQRPYQEIISVAASRLIEESHNIWNFSFPSVHAILAFAVLPIISKEFPKLKISLLILAILICLSRVYLGVHYLSDVLVGASIGYIIGNLGIKINDSKFIQDKIFKKLIH
jgi:undecaprenyl-diphosphatase